MSSKRQQQLARLERATVGVTPQLGPYLRVYRGEEWTMRTNGRVLVAVRGRFCRDTSGVSGVMRNLGMFRSGRDVPAADLRWFVGIKRNPTETCAEPISIEGVTVDRILMRRMVTLFQDYTLRIRASRDEHAKRPWALMIEGHDAIGVCMAHLGDPRAAFRPGRRAP